VSLSVCAGWRASDDAGAGVEVLVDEALLGGFDDGESLCDVVELAALVCAESWARASSALGGLAASCSPPPFRTSAMVRISYWAPLAGREGSMRRLRALEGRARAVVQKGWSKGARKMDYQGSMGMGSAYMHVGNRVWGRVGVERERDWRG
jgi:hypothetical protein